MSSDQVRDETERVLLENFPEVMVNGYSYTETDIWNVLLYASANRISIKAACERLSDAPSFNWIYTFLKKAVLNRYGMQPLEEKANESLKDTIPKRLGRSGRKLAVDLVTIPFYGDAETEGVRRSQAVKSTTKFFCFASAYVIKKDKRVTLSVTFVHPEDKLCDVLTRLLDRVKDLGIRIKRLYLDRQFAQVAILQHLSKQPHVSIVAIPKKGKAIKELLHGKKSFTVSYTMRSSEHGEITFPLRVACRYQKGKAKKHGAEFLPFAVIGTCRSDELQIAEEYRCRFGIESSYRIMNQTRARTSSKDERVRLLLVAIAFLLQNIWIWCKWRVLISHKRGGDFRVTFTLDLFAHFIRLSIEGIYGAVNHLKL